MSSFIESDNIQVSVLQQSLDVLLRQLSSELISILSDNPDAFLATIVINGKSFSPISSHCRHIMEVLQSIIHHDGRMIDYTNRKRDDSLVVSLHAFQGSIENTIQDIHKLQPIQEYVLKKDFLPDGKTSIDIPTTLLSELLYGISHTVHYQTISCVIISFFVRGFW